MTGHVRRVSMDLYDVLETVGASEKKRHLARNRAMTNEIFTTILYRKNMEYLFGGSRFEGSYTFDMFSDVDIIYYSLSNEVVEDQCEAKKIKSYLVVHDQCSHPGYIKMQLLLEGEPQTISNNVNFKPNDSHEADCMGRICLKYDTQWRQKQGPSAPLLDSRQKVILDRVFGLCLNTIPEFAQEWLSRKRIYDWPTKSHLSEMKDMGCLAVHVGHEWSVENAVEWRLSFSLQERLLMSNLNPVQHKVYLLLKVIKTELIKPKLGEELLTSYQCKSCVLHMVEQTPSTIWRKNNLVNCVILCLKTLLRWVNIQYCPNFFLKDQNLFAKTVFRKHSKALSRVLRDLLQLGDKIFYLLHTAHIGAMLTRQGYELRIGHNRMTVSLEIAHHTSQYLITKTNIHLLKRLETSQKRIQMLSLLEHLQNIKTIHFHKASETQDAISILIPWFHFYLARTILCESVGDSAASSDRNELADSNYHFSLLPREGQIPVRFSLAAYFYRIGKYEECYSLLKSIEHELVDSIFICTCDVELRYRMPYSMVSFCYEQPAEMLAQRIVNCEIFRPSEINIIPAALQVEMGRSVGVYSEFRDLRLQDQSDCAAVDPYCFLRFMQYLVGLALNKSAQKQQALRVLELLTNDDFGHRETAKNLLGWAYIQERRIGDAIRCFMESWQWKPVHNAAKIHMDSLSDTLFKAVYHWYHAGH